MSKRMQGYACLAVAMVLVGSTVTVSKVIGAGLPPFLATALRFAIALPLFLALMRATGARLPRLSRGDWTILLLQAAAGSVGYSALMILGLRLTSGANGAVLLGTLPVVAAATAVLVLGERPGRMLVAMVLLAGAGVAAMSLAPGAGAAGAPHALAGDLLILVAVACEALFILLNKRLKTPVAPLAQSTLMTGLGLLLVLPPAAADWQALATVDTAVLWAVVYYAVVPTVGGYLLWYRGAACTSGAEASLFTALAPVSGMALSVALLGEALQARQLFGAACVLAAILLPACVRRGGGEGGEGSESRESRESGGVPRARAR